MPGLLYFLPSSGPTIEDFAEGRLDVFGQSPSFERVPILQNGPGGKSGVILLLKTAGYKIPQRFGYYPADQSWQQAPGGDWWIGFEKAGRPTPEALARAEAVDGHAVRLDDGNLWTVPVARFAGGSSAFPKRLSLGPDGKLQVKPMERFEEISKAAESVWCGMMPASSAKADETTVTVENGWEIAVQALAVNYHVGALEVSALELLTTINLRAVLLALIDWPTIERILKAKAEADKDGRPFGTGAGSSTGSGATA
jgi:hypothetical protein